MTEPIRSPDNPQHAWKTDPNYHTRDLTVTQPDDPAYQLMMDGYTSTQTVYRSQCYICRDPEFAQMGLPLCQPCPECTERGRSLHPDDAEAVYGHIPADDPVCNDCGYDAYEAHMATQPVVDDD